MNNNSFNKPNSIKSMTNLQTVFVFIVILFCFFGLLNNFGSSVTFRRRAFVNKTSQLLNKSVSLSTYVTQNSSTTIDPTFTATTMKGNTRVPNNSTSSSTASPQYNEVEEIYDILKTTPTLWGYRSEKMRQHALQNRTEEQRKWITRISTTAFIQRSKPKKILAYIEPGEEYYYTDKKVNCPYAPDFVDKCLPKFVHLPKRHDILRHPPAAYSYKMEQVDAVINLRNGYWGKDVNFDEQLLPPGISQIFYQNESPCHTGSARLGQTGAWLAAYWNGADIPTSSYEMTESGRDEAGKNWYRHDRPLPNISTFAICKKKKKLAAALISNCRSVKNNRLGYISKLQKYINVDFYGKCGSLKCPQNCTDFLTENYKFYLAFENCNCEDYITEKFFLSGLFNGIVPVVMGAPKENYERRAPQHSFIHVDDFTSPKELAQHLVMLDGNDFLYERYFDWRSKPGAQWSLSSRNQEDFFCRVCGILYYADFVPPPPWPNRETRFADVSPCQHNSSHRNSLYIFCAIYFYIFVICTIHI